MSEAENVSHLGDLVPTEEALKHIGGRSEATFNNWKKHLIYVAHSRSGEDGKSNMYYVNCLEVRYAVFKDLKTRQFPCKFLQAEIGILFRDEFGSADEYLMKALSTRKSSEIIQTSINKFIEMSVDKVK